MVHLPSTPPGADYVLDTGNSFRSIIHGMPQGSQKVLVGTGEFIPTGPTDGATSIHVKENEKTGDFQEEANKTVPRSPSNQDILFPIGDNFLGKEPSTSHAPRPSLDYCSEQARLPFSGSHSGMDTIACDISNKNVPSSSFTKSNCAGISLSFSCNQNFTPYSTFRFDESVGIS